MVEGIFRPPPLPTFTYIKYGKSLNDDRFLCKILNLVSLLWFSLFKRLFRIQEFRVHVVHELFLTSSIL